MHVIVQFISRKDFLVNFKSRALSLGEKQPACEVHIPPQTSAAFYK